MPEPGTPRFAWLGGLIEGKRRDDAAVRHAVAALRALALTTIDLELDGPRFSVLLSSRPFPGRRLTDAMRTRLVAALQELAEAAADPCAVESTVRCTAVHRDSVVETLLAPVSGRIVPVSRARPLEPEDLARAPAPARRSPLAALGRGRQALVAVLLTLAAGAGIWQAGIAERTLAADAAALAVEAGPFTGLLAVTVESDSGSYCVRVRRGPRYPQRPDAAPALLDAGPDFAASAAIHAVTHGDTIYVQLRDGGGELLSSMPLGLRPLGTGATSEAVVHLPGKRAARAVALALGSG